MEAMDREETLLPSREKVKEEEEGGEGGLSPHLSRWRRNAAGAIIITAIYTNNFTTIITNSPPPLCSGVTPLLPAVIST